MKWTSVKDELPDEYYGLYLVYHLRCPECISGSGCTHRMIRSLDPVHGHNFYDISEWDGKDQTWCDEKWEGSITHWMRLPHPPGYIKKELQELPKELEKTDNEE